MFKSLLTALPVIGALALPAAAQSFPDHSLRIVHGFGAGGNADTVARIIAEELTQSLGQPVVVESRPGAGGTVASDYVSKQDPDGYTMQLMVGGHAVAAGLYNQLPYDSLNDFTFISTIGQFPFFVATQSGKYENIQALIDAAKAGPGSIKVGHSGVGSTQHLTGELLELNTGGDFLHIPYKGGAAAATALMGGEVDVLIDTGTVIEGQAAAGVFDKLAVTSAERWPDSPDVPTLAETVAPDFDVVSWTGIGMPAGVDPERAERIRADIHAALAKPEVQEKISALGATPAASSGEEMLQLVTDQITVWTDVVNNAGIEKR
ncbi:tripartite tricarboxylate transporter substrate binding protein [uncultured Maritimibacter sp.]|jgi:tripartite-type tricarboxylate transporter receptor subunit TctC|uniref:Bug family tripartite tricarboxylate transporter substrate binding protein n=1 Tax=uncultured Maritimibacter sp. TaxID=991866 RepID=UPI000B08522F|nr:tripartite tricarboxylate transporter substrate-binding protein [uncultured Maritimibacter sp.]